MKHEEKQGRVTWLQVKGTQESLRMGPDVLFNRERFQRGCSS